jgi:brefeldin A-inhibited guanine nucleotide-exchange protein
MLTLTLFDSRTIVAAPTCNVHRGSLLNLVRTCYNVHLKSKAPDNSHQASLQQMLEIVFARLPSDAVEAQRNAAAASTAASTAAAAVAAVAAAEDVSEAESETVTLGGDDNNQQSSSAGESVSRDPHDSATDDDAESSRDGADDPRTAPQSPAVSSSTAVAATTTTTTPAATAATSTNAAPSVSSPTPSPAPKAQSRGLFQSIMGAFSSNDAKELSQITSKSQWGNDLRIPDGDAEFSDCFLVFRALCKLSLKGVDQDHPEPFKSKILALELILWVLESCGSTLVANTRFVDTVLGKYLALSLIKNCVAPMPRVFQLSMQIARHVLTRFKMRLKPQCGVLWANYVHMLESPHSAVAQKYEVLRLIGAVCRVPQALVEIYLNYDCDVDGKDVFEQLVKSVARTAASAPTESPKLRREALLCLEVILASLVGWAEQLGALKAARQASDHMNESDVSSSSANAATSSSNAGGGDDDGDDGHGPRWLTLTPDAESIEKFRKAKDHKLMLEEGRSVFALSHKKGLQYFINGGLVENTPESIANFLRTTPGLDLTHVGEVIGGPKDQNKAILHAYVDSFSFTNMELDLALREFLYHFRIPGEAAIIDRILEKFAERYFAQNSRSIFPCADAAYVMSFSIMMLSTDLHSQAQKKKMTKAEWLENNRKYIPGMAENWDEAYMSALFDRIAAQPFQLQGDAARGGAAASATANDLSDPLQRQMAFMQETQQLVKDSQAAIRDPTRQSAEYHVAKRVEHLEPMFVAAAFPVLAPLSMLLGQTDDARILAQVLRCFEHACCISCLFAMQTERTAFIQTLAKFTGVHAGVTTLTQKQLACSVTLIKIARDNANFLQSSWSIVLGFVSDVDRLRNMDNVDESMFVEPTRATSSKKATAAATAAAAAAAAAAAPATASSEHSTAAATSAAGASAAAAAATAGGGDDGAAHEATLNGDALVRMSSTAHTSDTEPEVIQPPWINLSALDRIFTSSVHFSGSAILDFVTGLCEVSLAEVNDQNGPRFFSLVKLVVVATYNMNRIRWVWSRVWRILAAHFEKCGAHANVEVAMHAIDSLRQVSMKFLEKDELANFSFQKEFLRPFEVIMKKPPVPATRELIIRCVSQMIHARANNVKSGWKSIFAVFKVAAGDPEESIVALAFATVETIMKQFFTLIAESFFVECVSCLAAYGNNNLFKDIGLRAIASLQYCADQLASGAVCELDVPSQVARYGASPTPADIVAADERELPTAYRFTDSEQHMALWFPILTGLAAVIAHPHIDVRTVALNALFGLLRHHGLNFSPALWRVVFPSVLVPIFDPMRYAGNEPSPVDIEWLNTTCLNACRSLVDLVRTFFRRADFLLADLMKLLSSCILQGNESLAEIGTTSLLQFIVSASAAFRDADWVIVVQSIDHVTTANGDALADALLELLDAPSPAAAAAAAAVAAVDKPDKADKADKADGRQLAPAEAARTAFGVQLLVVECVDTVSNSQFALMGERLAYELELGLIKVRRQAGTLRARVEALAEPMGSASSAASPASPSLSMQRSQSMALAKTSLLVSTVANARRASIAPVVGLNPQQLARRYAGMLERLEAAAAAAACGCARTARTASVNASDGDAQALRVALTERRMLLPAMSDAAASLALTPCSILGQVAAEQLRWLVKEFPTASKSRHLASLHAIGVAAAKGNDRDASLAGIALMENIIELVVIRDEPLDANNGARSPSP